MKIAITIVLLFFGANLFAQNSSLQFEISQGHWVEDSHLEKGRLFLIFCKEEPTSIFDGLQYPDLMSCKIKCCWDINPATLKKYTYVAIDSLKNIKIC